MNLIGVDLGGTKCAVVLAHTTLGERLPEIVWKSEKHLTREFSPNEMLALLCQDIAYCIKQGTQNSDFAIGISCGSPLDSNRGIILSPPNMSSWDRIPVTEVFEKKFQIRTKLCNDANAGALAEWMWGAGKGHTDMVFLTFGTGMGAGLILNSQLYTGASDMAGEIGHVRLSHFGPSGYGKLGSFEGFCSGGGLEQLATIKILEARQQNRLEGLAAMGSYVSAADVGEAATKGDPLAIEILQICGNYLGQGLSILIDLLNPSRIVIGSIYARCQKWLAPPLMSVIHTECLPQSVEACSIVPAQLGEHIGDYAAIAVAKRLLL